MNLLQRFLNIFKASRPSQPGLPPPTYVSATNPGASNLASEANRLRQLPQASPMPSPIPSPSPSPAMAIAALRGTPAPAQSGIPVPPELVPAITSAAKKHGIDPKVLAAIAYQETKFRNVPEVGGGKGRGYFQIDLGQHPNVTEQQALDPNFAADYAAGLLKSRLDRYGGDVNSAIRAYNGSLTNPKTRKYLQSVQSILPQIKF